MRNVPRQTASENIAFAGLDDCVRPGHTPVHHAGAEIVEFSPTEILGETTPVVMRNLRVAGVAVGSSS